MPKRCNEIACEKDLADQSWEEAISHDLLQEFLWPSRGSGTFAATQSMGLDGPCPNCPS